MAVRLSCVYLHKLLPHPGSAGRHAANSRQSQSNRAALPPLTVLLHEVQDLPLQPGAVHIRYILGPEQEALQQGPGGGGQRRACSRAAQPGSPTCLVRQLQLVVLLLLCVFLRHGCRAARCGPSACLTRRAGAAGDRVRSGRRTEWLPMRGAARAWIAGSGSNQAKWARWACCRQGGPQQSHRFWAAIREGGCDKQLEAAGQRRGAARNGCLERCASAGARSPAGRDSAAAYSQ